MGIVFLSDRATTSTLLDSVARDKRLSTSREPISTDRYMQADNPDLTDTGTWTTVPVNMALLVLVTRTTFVYAILEADRIITTIKKEISANDVTE